MANKYWSKKLKKWIYRKTKSKSVVRRGKSSNPKRKSTRSGSSRSRKMSSSKYKKRRINIASILIRPRSFSSGNVGYKRNMTFKLGVTYFQSSAAIPANSFILADRCQPYFPNRPFMATAFAGTACNNWQRWTTTDFPGEPGKYDSYIVNAVKCTAYCYTASVVSNVNWLEQEDTPLPTQNTTTGTITTANPLFARFGWLPNEDTTFGLAAMAASNPQDLGLIVFSKKMKNDGRAKFSLFRKLPQNDRYNIHGANFVSPEMKAGEDMVVGRNTQALKACSATSFNGAGVETNHCNFFFGIQNQSNLTQGGAWVWKVYVKYYVTLFNTKNNARNNQTDSS